MGLDSTQLRQMVIMLDLEKLELWSETVQELVLSAVVVESAIVYILQHGAGPALGLWLVEQRTHDDFCTNYLSCRQELGLRLMEQQSPALSMDKILATNLIYGAAGCRL